MKTIKTFSVIALLHLIAFSSYAKEQSVNQKVDGTFSDPFAAIFYDNYAIGLDNNYYSDVTVYFFVNNYNDFTPVSVNNVTFNYKIEYEDLDNPANNYDTYDDALCNGTSTVLEYGALIQSDINNLNENYMYEYIEEEGTGYYTRFTI